MENGTLTLGEIRLLWENASEAARQEALRLLKSGFDDNKEKGDE